MDKIADSIDDLIQKFNNLTRIKLVDEWSPMDVVRDKNGVVKYLGIQADDPVFKLLRAIIVGGGYLDKDTFVCVEYHQHHPTIEQLKAFNDLKEALSNAELS